MTPDRHGSPAPDPVPPEAALAADPDLWLAWAPLVDRCQGGKQCDAMCRCEAGR